MTKRRLLCLVVSVAAAASVICVGASALAASHGTPENYRGPARPAHAVTIMHRTNYQGPARTSAHAASARVHGSNQP